MMYLRAALALAGTVGLLVLFAVEPYKALLEERMGWRPSESPARRLSKDGWRRIPSKTPSRASRSHNGTDFVVIDDYMFAKDISGYVGDMGAKFMGAAAVPGMGASLVLAPLNSDSIGVVQGCPDSGSDSEACLRLVDISAQISGPDKFNGACTYESQEGPKIVFVPFSADAVGIFDPISDNFRLVDISDKIDVDGKFVGCAVGPNGKIVFAPSYGGVIGIFSPWNDEFELVDISAQIHGDDGLMFLGAVASESSQDSGKIIFVPGNAHSVGVFDPFNYNFHLVDLPAEINGSMEMKWAEGALAPNGKIIFAPLNADAVGVFDPVDDSLSLVDISAKITGEYKFMGASTTNGKIIFAPFNADAVGAFFPASNTFELFDISAAIDRDEKYAGAVAAPYPGSIETMFVPFNAGNLAWFIDCSTGECPNDDDGSSTVTPTGAPTAPSQISCSGPSCGLIEFSDLGNGEWKIWRGSYGENERATLTLYGPGTVVFQHLALFPGPPEGDYLNFGGDHITGFSVPADIHVPEGPQEVVWYSDGLMNVNSPDSVVWSFIFRPTFSPTTSTTTTSFIQLKLKLKVKGKSHLKAWMKVKIVDGGVEASAKVKESHRRRRRRRRN